MVVRSDRCTGVRGGDARRDGIGAFVAPRTDLCGCGEAVTRSWFGEDQPGFGLRRRGILFHRDLGCKSFGVEDGGGAATRVAIEDVNNVIIIARLIAMRVTRAGCLARSEGDTSLPQCHVTRGEEYFFEHSRASRFLGRTRSRPSPASSQSSPAASPRTRDPSPGCRSRRLTFQITPADRRNSPSLAAQWRGVLGGPLRGRLSERWSLPLLSSPGPTARYPSPPTRGRAR